jgi:hypothetical protein
MFTDKAESAKVRLLMRYLGTAERAYYKAIADLNKAQAERRRQEREDAQHEAMQSMYEDVQCESAESDTQPVIDGFVSQPAPAYAMAASALPSAHAFHARI